MPFAVGDLIAERYVLERWIGSGGFSEVWQARDRRVGHRLALKLMQARGGLRQEVLARFQREAKVGFVLGRETGFVRCLDWGEAEAFCWLAMDLVRDGSDLFEGVDTLLGMIAQLAEAARLVATMHAAGIVHRDLKPPNLLVDAHGRVMVTDFGLARPMASMADFPELHMHRVTRSSAIGTPAYMAPEQVRAMRTAGPPADVFALGVMLYQAISGRLPFGEDFGEILAAHELLAQGLRPPPPSEYGADVPEVLDDLCMASIELEPAVRPTAAEFSHLLWTLIDLVTRAPGEDVADDLEDVDDIDAADMEIITEAAAPIALDSGSPSADRRDLAVSAHVLNRLPKKSLWAVLKDQASHGLRWGSPKEAMVVALVSDGEWDLGELLADFEMDDLRRLCATFDRSPARSKERTIARLVAAAQHLETLVASWQDLPGDTGHEPGQEALALLLVRLPKPQLWGRVQEHLRDPKTQWRSAKAEMAMELGAAWASDVEGLFEQLDASELRRLKAPAGAGARKSTLVKASCWLHEQAEVLLGDAVVRGMVDRGRT